MMMEPIQCTTVSNTGGTVYRLFRPRRPHTKSRSGCAQCRKRRIKVSQVRPGFVSFFSEANTTWTSSATRAGRGVADAAGGNSFADTRTAVCLQTIILVRRQRTILRTYPPSPSRRTGPRVRVKKKPNYWTTTCGTPAMPSALKARTLLLCGLAFPSWQHAVPHL